MEKNSPDSFSPEPSPDWKFSAADEKFFLSHQFDLDTTKPHTTERYLKTQADYLDKLVDVPLPIETMMAITSQLVADYSLLEQSSDQFSERFIDELAEAAANYLYEAQPGDHVCFQDIIEEVDNSLSSIQSHQQDNTIDSLLIRFGYIFENQSDLAYIGDNIDAWTVNSSTHPVQAERQRFDPDAPFYDQPHGHNGRWKPQDRDGLLVWVLANDQVDER